MPSLTQNTSTLIAITQGKTEKELPLSKKIAEALEEKLNNIHTINMLKNKTTVNVSLLLGKPTSPHKELYASIQEGLNRSLGNLYKNNKTLKSTNQLTADQPIEPKVSPRNRR